MNPFASSGLLIGVTSVAMGIFVYAKNTRNKINRLWAIFSYSVAFWGFGAFEIGITKEASVALLWWKIAHVGVIFIPVLFIHFVFAFLEKKEKWPIIVGYVIGTFFLIANLSGYLIKNVVWVFASFYYDGCPPTLLYTVFTFFWFFSICYSHFQLLLGLRGMGGIKKTQIKYFFLATAVGFSGGITCFLPCFGIEIYPFLNFTVPLYPLIMTYAIIRHKLMDIEVVIKKTLIFTGVFAVAFGVFVGFAYLGSIWFENVVKNRWVALVPSVLAIVVILRPLENFLRDITDKFLFQKQYDYKHLIKTFTEEVLTVIEFNDLVHLTVNKLAEILKLENTLLFLYDAEGEQYRLAASVLEETSGNILTVLEENGSLTEYMRKSREYFLLEGTEQQKNPPPRIQKELQELETALVIPLIHHDNMVGILSLGKKKSDEDFTQDDIDVLLPLANTLSIAITNATLFKELSKAQARAAQREKMAVIGTLSAGINHEICNPLGIARGQCELFLLNMAEGIYKGKSSEELLDKAQEIMRKVIHETDRATLITRKLSSFAKPAKGEVLDNISLGKEMEVVISLLEHDLKLDNISIIKEIPEKLPNISADRKQLQEIFFNIIRNAVQSIKDTGKIFIRLSSDGKKVYVEIEDTGEGISKHGLNQIFDPFFTTKDPGEGTGLGLYIVKQIVEKNKGTITVRSEHGKGTIFLLTFNVVKPIEEKQ